MCVYLQTLGLSLQEQLAGNEKAPFRGFLIILSEVNLLQININITDDENQLVLYNFI
jgi:hypothetical protein